MGKIPSTDPWQGVEKPGKLPGVDDIPDEESPASWCEISAVLGWDVSRGCPEQTCSGECYCREKCCYIQILLNLQSFSVAQWVQGWWEHALGANQPRAPVGLDILYGITVPCWDTEHLPFHTELEKPAVCEIQRTAWWKFLADSSRQHCCHLQTHSSSLNIFHQGYYAGTAFQPPLDPGSVGTFTWISRDWIGFRHLAVTPGGCSTFHRTRCIWRVDEVANTSIPSQPPSIIAWYKAWNPSLN